MTAPRLALALLGASLATPALAQPFCAQLKTALSQMEAGQPISPLPGATSCTAQTGPHSMVCLWAFGYRSKAATAAYLDLGGKLRGCYKTGVEVQQDQTVNHPDTSLSWLYMLDDLSLRLAIKDKAALGKTLIVLQATPRLD